MCVTCESAEESLAATAVPHQQGVGRAPLSKLHVDALRAQPHLQVAQLTQAMPEPLLHPIRWLASADRQVKCPMTEEEMDAGQWCG